MSISRSTEFVTTNHTNGSVTVVKAPAPDLTDLEKGQLVFAIGMITMNGASFNDACSSALYYADRANWLTNAGMPKERASVVARTRVSTFLGLRP